MEIKPIGYLKTQFPTKFGIPRQSGAVASSRATLIFEEEYRSREALRGLEEYSHVWVIWGFSQAKYEKFSPTVRPPRLGGNLRMGVFATRSPFRPNSLGLSVLKLEKIEKTEKYGHVIHLLGADMLDGTPVYDLKPYLPSFDKIDCAIGGFSEKLDDYILEVVIPTECEKILSENSLACLKGALAQDPRPSYIEDENRVFGFPFEDYEVKFKVEGKILTVISIEKQI
ncbi:MAG: tRNA (N6-threonylcarbamoyladenosine(37)-N6)-methyltransferase TrmO [Clostridia bacterium]|nr:tRNA (N6-threonylcarbamoyladenosine(37)-N6)-methyltransferase TrmO [Clostridia bacterium]